ncbi:T9SS type A sorting domain-containing protein [bacterium]|nr:T9SS type A sorting domain-containing protein [bacterium]MBU1983119.1 T9SS type A sorting domain-containing protein [bacterium]
MAVSDQSGGLYVVWSDYRLAPGPVLAGSHVNADGEIGPDPFWAPELGGILSDSILGIVNEPWLVAGPSGTAVVFWVHDRQQSSNQFLDLYAQRIGAVGLSAEEPASTVPSGFALFPCYPNPFNSATAIVFELATASFVKLTVYDLLGREVAVLTDRVLPMGRHEYLFNASALASGIYFYRLQAGNFTQTRKMVLVR